MDIFLDIFGQESKSFISLENSLKKKVLQFLSTSWYLQFWNLFLFFCDGPELCLHHKENSVTGDSFREKQ